MKTFGTEFQNLSAKGSFPPKKTHFWGFSGYTCGARAAALASRPLPNLSIAPYTYSRRARDVCTLSDFFIRLTIFEIQGYSHPNFRNFATCCHISVDATVLARKADIPVCELRFYWDSSSSLFFVLFCAL